MILEELVNKKLFEVVNLAENMEQEVEKPFCCDLLSIAMSKAPANSAWVTVMGNINTIAVSSLTDVTCVILAERAVLDPSALEKAKSQNVTVLSTELPIFEAALAVYEAINA